MEHWRVLIAGCGYVGSVLAGQLLERGHHVWGLRRRVERLPEGVQGIAADLSDPDTLWELPAKLDYVVYAASAGGRSDEQYRAAYVDGVGNLLSALRQGNHPVRRVLFTSSTGVYGQTSGEWVDEDSPTEPTDFTGARLLEGEQLLLGGPFPAVVLRLGGIYGPGRTRLIEQVRRGEAKLPAGPPRYTNRIHRDDAAAALAHLIPLPSPEPLYLGVDDEPADLADVYRWLAVQLGAPLPPRAKTAADQRPRSNKRCRNTRLRASGFMFRNPTFREGYARLLGGAGA